MVTQFNNSVTRAFAILNLFAETRRILSTADVVDSLGLNTITAHRFLKTLEGEGALVQETKGRYRLGYMLVDLGHRANTSDNIGHLLQPLLDEISNETQEASMATVYQNAMVVCVARGLAHRSLSVDVRVGTRLEAYCTAHGKLWLSNMGTREQTRYIENFKLINNQSATKAAKEKLKQDIEHTHQQGFATNNGEREEGITAIAVPVYSRDGNMITGLSVFGPSSRMTPEIIEKAHKILDHAAKQATQLFYGIRK